MLHPTQPGRREPVAETDAEVVRPEAEAARPEAEADRQEGGEGHRQASGGGAGGPASGPQAPTRSRATNDIDDRTGFSIIIYDIPDALVHLFVDTIGVTFNLEDVFVTTLRVGRIVPDDAIRLIPLQTTLPEWATAPWATQVPTAIFAIPANPLRRLPTGAPQIAEALGMEFGDLWLLPDLASFFFLPPLRPVLGVLNFLTANDVNAFVQRYLANDQTDTIMESTRALLRGNAILPLRVPFQVLRDVPERWLGQHVVPFLARAGQVQDAAHTGHPGANTIGLPAAGAPAPEAMLTNTTYPVEDWSVSPRPTTFRRTGDTAAGSHAPNSRQPARDLRTTASAATWPRPSTNPMLDTQAAPIQLPTTAPPFAPAQDTMGAAFTIRTPAQVSEPTSAGLQPAFHPAAASWRPEAVPPSVRPDLTLDARWATMVQQNDALMRLVAQQQEQLQALLNPPAPTPTLLGLQETTPARPRSPFSPAGQGSRGVNKACR